MVEVFEFSTHYKILNCDECLKGVLTIIENLTSTTYDGAKFPLGHLYDSYRNILRVPRGYTLERLRNELGVDLNVKRVGHMPLDETPVEFSIKVKPFDYQEKIIKECVKSFKENSQFIIDLPTGKGKSLTSLFIASLLKVNTLIIVKDTNLLNQWYGNIIDKTSCTRNDILVMQGMGAVNYVESMSRPHKFYIIQHASIRAIIDKIGYGGFNKMLVKMNVGLKIIDEFDLEVKNIIEFDLQTAIKFNLYETATVYKNSKSDDAVFQNIFGNTPRMGKEFFTNEVPNRDCIWVKYNSMLPIKMKQSCYIKDNFVSYYYNDMMFKRNPHIIKELAEPYVKEYMSVRDKDDICAIYVEKIESCGYMFSILQNIGVDPKDIGIINSEIESSDKAKAFIRPFIITTIKSFGRGVDVSGLTYIINFENYAGMSLFEQQIGRIGRVGGKRGKYINFVDTGFFILVKYNSRKERFLDQAFDKVDIINYKLKGVEEK